MQDPRDTFTDIIILLIGLIAVVLVFPYWLYNKIKNKLYEHKECED